MSDQVKAWMNAGNMGGQGASRVLFHGMNSLYNNGTESLFGNRRCHYVGRHNPASAAAACTPLVETGVDDSSSSWTGDDDTFQVVVEYKPAYELLMSLGAFVWRSLHSSLELGKGWVGQVRKSMPSSLASEFTKLNKDWGACPSLLIQQSPAGQDIPEFLTWMESLSPAEIYEIYAPSGTDLPPSFGEWKECWRRHLGLWYEVYFKSIDPAILTGLAADADLKRGESGNPQILVERATNGLYFPPLPELERIILVPQYHCLPFNICENFGSRSICLYPVDVTPLPEGQPSPRLLRLTRALADESRLRILGLLASGPCSFSEIVQTMGLAKSTIHHHLINLRAAGLVRVLLNEAGGPATPRTARFTMRPGALDDLTPKLKEFLQDQPPQRP